LTNAPPGAFLFCPAGSRIRLGAFSFQVDPKSTGIPQSWLISATCNFRFMPIDLVIFDVDGVLKEVVDPYMLLHRHFGTVEEGKRHFRAFREGHITYHEFAQLDAWSWRGQSVDEIKSVLRSTPYIPGSFEAAAGLRERGIPFVLLSSGFDLNVADVADDLGADDWRANILHQDRGRIVGSMTVRVPYGGKGPLVREIIQRWDVDPARVLAVGDSDTDIRMFEQTGHALAIRPRSEAVSQAADATMPDLSMFVDFLDSLMSG
jgi:phosphoserine phosphatase